MKTKKKRKHPELNALKGKIREMGKSYRVLAEEIGIGLNTLSDKINGYQSFSADEMEQIAIALEINPRDIAHYFLPAYCKTQHRSA